MRPQTILTAGSRFWTSVRRAASLVAKSRILREESGGSLVELALIMVFFYLPLLIGTGEVGLLVYDSIEISNAAQAGTDYGMGSATLAADNAGMTTAAQSEASEFGTLLTVTPLTYYVCAAAVTGTQYTGSNAQANATAGCTGTNNHALQFVQVTTSATVKPPIHLPGLPTSYLLQGFSAKEVRS
jgi:Flp pilus assembly protein TadG